MAIRNSQTPPQAPDLGDVRRALGSRRPKTVPGCRAAVAVVCCERAGALHLLFIKRAQQSATGRRSLVRTPRLSGGTARTTVLQGVLDSARTLTGAGYGVMTLLDDAGAPREFLLSGMTAEEEGRTWSLPEGMRVYEYLGSLPSPLRLPDLLGHLLSRGLPEPQLPLSAGPVLSYLAAPVIHRGERAGNLFLGGKGHWSSSSAIWLRPHRSVRAAFPHTAPLEGIT